MAYEWEHDEWRSAVRSMTELDRYLAVQEPRRAAGIIGDRSDAYDDLEADTDE